MKKVNLYTDGACSGNPGPGGYGAILEYGGRKKELSGGYVETTNNRMELMAVIKGLDALKEPCDVTVISDSKYVTDAINKGKPLFFIIGYLKSFGCFRPLGQFGLLNSGNSCYGKFRHRRLCYGRFCYRRFCYGRLSSQFFGHGSLSCAVRLSVTRHIGNIVTHISLSVLVWFAAKKPGKLWFFPMAILLHAVMDGLTVILAPRLPLYTMEASLVVMALLLVLLARTVWKRNAEL